MSRYKECIDTFIRVADAWAELAHALGRKGIDLSGWLVDQDLLEDKDLREYIERYSNILNELAECSILVYRRGPPDSYTLYYVPAIDAWIEHNYQVDENYYGLQWDEPLGLVHEFLDLREALEWLREQDLPSKIKKELRKMFRAYLD